MTNFPKKVFEEEDYEKPLDMLGLVPTASIIVMKWTTHFLNSFCLDFVLKIYNHVLERFLLKTRMLFVGGF